MKIRSKFRLVIALYMAVPLGIILFFVKDSPLFLDSGFQAGLILCITLMTLVVACSPLMMGLNWLFLDRMREIDRMCDGIKKGVYTYFDLGNEPALREDEDEMAGLKRNMNWMVHQIEAREMDLEKRVAQRTRDLEETNQALIKARDEANASARAKSQFLATMSHEIRTPMNAVIGMSDLVLQADLTPSQKEQLTIINSSSKALLNILNDILDFSKMDAGRLDIEKIAVNLKALFEEITDMFRHQAADSNVEFILDLDPALPAKILSDPMRLRQVLVNLISNAVKFTREGEICVRAAVVSHDDQTAVLEFSVRDTGVGMAPEVMDKLFSAFTQADGSTSRQFGGTGLGLAISRKLVNLMGGDITVESETGKGSTFSFSLTVQVVEPGSPCLVLPETLCGRRVLLAAGNENARKVMERFLTDFGLNVSSHGTFSQALSAWSRAGEQGETPFALALLDADLPDPAGPGFLDTAWFDPMPFPVVALGRFGRQGRAPSWAKALVPKPVKQSQLYDAIAEVLENPRDTGLTPGEADPFPLAGARILLVEDNKVNQKVAAQILRTRGIDPVIADSGTQAVELVSGQLFHAVLMDIQMPGMDGYEATRQIRALPKAKDLPIIAMTANAMAHDRQKGVQAGMDEYITKPVEAGRLFEALLSLVTVAGAGPIAPRSLPDREAPGQQAALPALPGINVKTAAHRLNQEMDLLYELVIEFVAENRDNFGKIRHSLLSGRHQEARALVHKLKGVSRNLSADELAENLEQLEYGLDRVNGSLDDGTLDKLLDRAQTAFETIVRTAGRITKDREGKKPAPASDRAGQAPSQAFLPDRETLDMVREMGRLIDENSLDAKKYSRLLAVKFSATPLSGQAQAIESRLKRFDFGQARQVYEQFQAGVAALEIKEGL